MKSQRKVRSGLSGAVLNLQFYAWCPLFRTLEMWNLRFYDAPVKDLCVPMNGKLLGGGL